MTTRSKATTSQIDDVFYDTNEEFTEDSDNETDDHGNLKGFTHTDHDHKKQPLHTIFMLFGLPKIEFEGALAHELMHVWLFERQVRLSLREIEGFCNLGNYLVFSRKPSPMASYLLKNLQTDDDPIYGGGYRLMRKHLDAHGWENLLAKFGPAPVSTPKKKFRLLMFGNK